MGLFLSVDPAGDAARAAARTAAWKAWNNLDREKQLIAFTTKCSEESFDKVLLRIASGLAADVRASVLAWYNEHQPFPGVLGSGIYTADQINFHRRLSRAIATQHSVSVRTKFTLKGVAESVLPTGESMISGLVGRHAYSVTGTKEEARGTGPDRVVLYYIGVRNPWGKFSRGYSAGPGPMTPQQQDSRWSKQAESWIELTDFVENFQEDFVEGPQVHDAARTALMNDRDFSLQAQLQRRIDEITLDKWGRGV